ncbi:hypothetical protein GCM10018793_44280 [Streptomyces sulfonofaciens]|uniref:Uncharacterized protein n=1 Tax=Streptomyces sulfonofaciens TaxID=68272 RepID=A0A919L316_9ACTN|nr:hypothetical protein GCM10018793_44280 [Streptomyces sulfonofaciens]
MTHTRQRPRPLLARLRRVHDALVAHTGLGLGQIAVVVTAVLTDAAWALYHPT